jgi:DNA-binding transcriptional MerR regulator
MASSRTALVSTSLVRRPQTLIGVEALSQATGLHPEVIRRLIRLGLIEAAGGSEGAPVFEREVAPRLTRALRLRRDLGLNYAGAVLAGELLDRINELEERLRLASPERRPAERRHAPTPRPHREVITWTRIV